MGLSVVKICLGKFSFKLGQVGIKSGIKHVIYQKLASFM